MTDRELDVVRSDLDRVRQARQRQTPPAQGLGVALDLLAEHIAYERVHGSRVKAQRLACVHDQLSAIAKRQR